MSNTPDQQSTNKKKRRKKTRAPIVAIALLVIVATVISTLVLLLLAPSSKIDKLRGLLNRRRKISSLQHQDAYDTAYRQKGKPPYKISERVDDFLSNNNSYGLTKFKCSLTVVLMDPRIATDGPGQPVWFALESVALYTANNDETCFLIQTSSCAVPDDTAAAAEDIILQQIYHQSLPHFRQVMEQHRVRITFLDYSKYNMNSCDNFNPNAAFLNKHYWTDEFIEADSEVVLVMQADTVLCRDLDLVQFSHYAWVGAVWPPHATLLFPEPMEGMCRGMPARYKSWIRPQRKWEKQQAEVGGLLVPKPRILLPSTFPAICDNNGIAPVGNGGLSLRNRSWMIRAIEACPHVQYSGQDDDLNTVTGCKVLDDINEDFYFGTVLRGMEAPLPNAYEASLFSSESLWTEHVVELYNGGEAPTSENENVPTIEFGGKTLTVPTGFHKPWAYQSNDLLLSDQLDEACPLLRYIFEPNESRYQAPTKDKKVGFANVGT